MTVFFFFKGGWFKPLGKSSSESTTGTEISTLFTTTDSSSVPPSSASLPIALLSVLWQIFTPIITH